jgi:signal transduction histidine kinase
VPDVEELANHEVELDLEPLEASVDPTAVERIVENLLTNTGRHTPAGSHVWVRVRAQGDAVLIMVEDDGPGVPEELRRQIFEPFRQGGGERRGRGLGIGLSLVARFASLHDGWADVVEREGGGACFRAFLANASPVPKVSADGAGQATELRAAR